MTETKTYLLENIELNKNLHQQARYLKVFVQNSSGLKMVKKVRLNNNDLNKKQYLNEILDEFKQINTQIPKDIYNGNGTVYVSYNDNKLLRNLFSEKKEWDEFYKDSVEKNNNKINRVLISRLNFSVPAEFYFPVDIIK